MKRKFLIGVILVFGICEAYQLTGIVADDEDGKTRVVITQDGVPQYRAFTMLNPPRLIIDLLNCEDSLSKERIENRSSAIVGISSQQRLKEPVKIARVIVRLKSIFPYQLLSDKNKVIIEMETGMPGKREEMKPLKEEEAIEPKKGILPLLGKMEEAIKPKEEKKEKVKEEELISMRFYETDIHDALRVLSKKIGRDIVVGPDVSAIISIELNNVKWDNALNMLLKPYNLGWVLEEGIIRVDTKENLLKTAIKTEVVPINYDKAEEMAKIIEPLLDPDAGGKIVVDKRTNSLIITTTAQNLEQMKGVIKSIDLSTPQIMIEAKMVQIDVTEVEKLGINWGFTHPSAASNYTRGEVTLGEGAGAQISIGRIINTTNLFLTLNHLIEKEKAELITAPKIATSNNQKAKIKVGTQLPYGETTAATVERGEAGITIKFMDVSIELEVTPKANPDNTISLDLKVADKGGKLIEILVGGRSTTAPLTTERALETKILVNNGETIVIGGMIGKSEKITQYSVPFLSDLPFIGRAFRYKAISLPTKPSIKRELLVFLTPHILNR